MTPQESQRIVKWAHETHVLTTEEVKAAREMDPLAPLEATLSKVLTDARIQALAEEMRRVMPTLARAPATRVDPPARHVEVLNAPRQDSGVDKALPPGARVGTYEVVRLLGRGGMGVVYEARHATLGRRAALKVIDSNLCLTEEFMSRFRREAHATARLRHPNIVKVYEVDLEAERPFIAMELVEGKPLDEVIHFERIPPRRAATLALAAAEALAYAHAEGVIHRDVKPANIMVGAGDHVTVMDFGLAWEAEGSLITRSIAVLGTPVYMPPEQAQGTVKGGVTAQADVYSLGATLYHMLTEQPPFEAKAALSVLREVIETEPTPPRKRVAAVPRDLETITLKAMEKKKERRYATMAAFAADLKRWLEGEPIQARPVSMMERLVRKARKNRAATALGAVALVVLAVALGMWWRARQEAWKRAREVVADFRARHKKGEANAYEALGEAFGLVGDAEEVLRAKAEGREEDLRRDVEAQKWEAAEKDIALLGEADQKLGMYKGELVQMGRLVKGTGTLEIHTEPEGTEFTLYDFNERGLWDVQQDPKKWTLLTGKTPLAKQPWEMGQYLIIFHLDGYADTNYPIWIERNKDEAVRVKLLRTDQVPAGMVYVPEGDTKLVGKSTGATKCYHVKSFLASRDDVTQAEYSAVLQQAGSDIPRYTPKYGDGSPIWSDAKPPAGWEDLPVFGITAEDAHFYAARVGARLPTWEEYVRMDAGAGDRSYPWGRQWDSKRLAWMNTVGGRLPAPSAQFLGGVSGFGCRHIVGNLSQIVTLRGPGESLLHVAVGGDYMSAFEPEFSLDPDASSTVRRTPTSERTGFRVVRDLQ